MSGSELTADPGANITYGEWTTAATVVRVATRTSRGPSTHQTTRSRRAGSRRLGGISDSTWGSRVLVRSSTAVGPALDGLPIQPATTAARCHLGWTSAPAGAPLRPDGRGRRQSAAGPRSSPATSATPPPPGDLLDDPDGGVRERALGALARTGTARRRAAGAHGRGPRRPGATADRRGDRRGPRRRRAARPPARRPRRQRRRGGRLGLRRAARAGADRTGGGAGHRARRSPGRARPRSPPSARSATPGPCPRSWRRPATRPRCAAGRSSRWRRSRDRRSTPRWRPPGATATGRSARRRRTSVRERGGRLVEGRRLWSALVARWLAAQFVLRAAGAGPEDRADRRCGGRRARPRCRSTSRPATTPTGRGSGSPPLLVLAGIAVDRAPSGIPSGSSGGWPCPAGPAPGRRCSPPRGPHAGRARRRRRARVVHGRDPLPVGRGARPPAAPGHARPAEGGGGPQRRGARPPVDPGHPRRTRPVDGPRR